MVPAPGIRKSRGRLKQAVRRRSETIRKLRRVKKITISFMIAFDVSFRMIIHAAED
jgi:hypothetical protein